MSRKCRFVEERVETALSQIQTMCELCATLDDPIEDRIVALRAAVKKLTEVRDSVAQLEKTWAKPMGRS